MTMGDYFTHRLRNYATYKKSLYATCIYSNLFWKGVAKEALTTDFTVEFIDIILVR